MEKRLSPQALLFEFLVDESFCLLTGSQHEVSFLFGWINPDAAQCVQIKLHTVAPATNGNGVEVAETVVPEGAFATQFFGYAIASTE